MQETNSENDLNGGSGLTADQQRELDLMPTEAEIDVGNLSELAKESLDWFAGSALPAEITFPFPSFYQFLWATLTSALFKFRDFSKFALALPRGHGKTMFIKFIVLFVILFTKRRFVAVICATQDKAENIIRDVIDMLDSQNMRNIYGDWDNDVSKNAVETKIFKFRGRNIILKAEGAGTSFRGVNIKNARPDVMIFDDVQTKDVAESPVVAKKFISWFQGTALKAKDPTKCTFIYVGNMYANVLISENAATGKKIFGCMLRNLKDNKNWKTIITGGIQAKGFTMIKGKKVKGTALWEDLQPLEQLLSEFEDDRAVGEEEVFFAEVMNDPDAKINSDFDFNKIEDNPYEPSSDWEPDGKYLVIDPSLGKEVSDKQAVGEFWIYDGEPIYRSILPYEITQVDSPTLVRNLITYCLENGIGLILVETYAYQASLIQWFDVVLNQMGITGIEIRGVSRGTRSKVSAILDWFKVLLKNDMYLHSDVKSFIFNQIRSYDKTKAKNRDDLLDIGYYGYSVKKNPEIFDLAFRINGEVLGESSGELIIPSGNYR